MRVHVFKCPECEELWTLPVQYIDDDPRDECDRCGATLRHGTTEVTHGVD